MECIRHAVLALYRHRFQRRPPSPVDPSARTLVFAPHPDDETLGCGGTIALKIQEGANVQIVFMTDGSRSNWPLMDPEVLAAVRETEAIAASATLGVQKGSLDFLRFPDGSLSEHAVEASRQVALILERESPDEIFVPYRNDPQNDHRATAAIVLEVLGTLRLPVRIFEYPIWLWLAWPWVPVGFGLGRRQRALMKATMRMRFGWRFLQEFKHTIDVTAVEAMKRAALDEYKSQRTRVVPNPGWMTLDDISGGAFLENLTGPIEVFRKSSVPVRSS